MLLLTVHEIKNPNAITLRFAVGRKIFETYILHKCNIVPKVEDGMMFKLTGYMLCYDDLDITVETNGQIELYVDGKRVISDILNSGTAEIETGIHEMVCYIKPSQYPASYKIMPNVFTLNNGEIQFLSPKPLCENILSFKFVNPDKYTRQKYYVNGKPQITFYSDYNYQDDKYTVTTVAVIEDE